MRHYASCIMTRLILVFRIVVFFSLGLGIAFLGVGILAILVGYAGSCAPSELPMPFLALVYLLLFGGGPMLGFVLTKRYAYQSKSPLSILPP